MTILRIPIKTCGMTVKKKKSDTFGVQYQNDKKINKILLAIYTNNVRDTPGIHITNRY